MKVFEQALKFGIVGLGNTLLTLGIIWVMTESLGYAAIPANISGYAVGIISSYIFNKQWTFRSAVGWKKSAIRFFIVCAICYLVQFVVLVILNRYYLDNPPLYAFFKPVLVVLNIGPSYYIHLFAMVFYTLLNFFFNKYYTFKA